MPDWWWMTLCWPVSQGWAANWAPSPHPQWKIWHPYKAGSHLIHLVCRHSARMIPVFAGSVMSKYFRGRLGKLKKYKHSTFKVCNIQYRQWIKVNKRIFMGVFKTKKEVFSDVSCVQWLQSSSTPCQTWCVRLGRRWSSAVKSVDDPNPPSPWRAPTRTRWPATAASPSTSGNTECVRVCVF